MMHLEARNIGIVCQKLRRSAQDVLSRRRKPSGNFFPRHMV